MNELKQIKRNELGLIEGLEYQYTEEGLVDWKKMIPPQFLYVNNDPKRRDKLEKKYKKSYSEIDPIKDNVDDVDLVQMLGAAKYLLKLRGFNDLKYIIKEANENYAAVNCRIVFRENYESENKPIAFEDNACAHFNNTNGFGRNYLIEMATNRAFARCVRNALNISIVSKEELGGESTGDEPKSSVPDKSISLLEDLMKNKHVLFDPHIKKKLVDSNQWDDNYKSVGDLPKNVIFDLLSRLKKFDPKT